MVVIVGCIIVVGAVLLGFSMAGGHVHALIHPSEFVTIGGASLGALVVMSPVKTLKDLARGLVQTVKGSPFNKKAYADLFRRLYSIGRTVRREGSSPRRPSSATRTGRSSRSSRPSTRTTTPSSSCVTPWR